MKALLALAWRLNVRHFAARRLRASLTVAGIAGGVALVFSITAINSTLFSTVRATIRDVAGAAEIEVSGPGPNSLPADLQTRVEAAEGVAGAVPVLRVMAPVKGSDGTARAMVLGVTPEFAHLFPRDAPVARLSGGFGGGTGLVLAEDLTAAIGVSRGGSVFVDTPGGPRELQVTGTLGGSALRSVNGGHVGVMFLPAAQAVFDRQDRIDALYVVTDPKADRADVAAAVRTVVPPGIKVGDPAGRSRSLDDTLQSVTALTSLAAIVALFVAVFVVYNTVSVSLAERRRDIAMTLSLGATKRQLALAFAIEAVLLGVVAAAVGIGSGFAIASVLLDAATSGYEVLLPVGNVGALVVTPGQILLSVAAGTLVSTVGASLPVHRLLKIAPVEALRPTGGTSGPETTGAGSPLGAVAGLVLVLVVGASVVFFDFDFTWSVAVAVLLPVMVGVTLLLPWSVRFALALLTPVVRIAGVVGALAAAALERNLRRTTLTVGALVMTSALVIGVAGALGSMKAEVERRTRVWFFAPLYVTAETYTGFSSDQPLRRDLRPRLEAIAGVKHALPQRYGVAELGGEQTILYGVSTGEARELGVVEDFPPHVRNYWDEVLDRMTGSTVAISHYTADTLGTGPGEDITLPTPRGERSFRVVSLFDDLAPFNTLYIELDTYSRLWNDRGADRFSIFPEPGTSIGELRKEIERELDASGAPAIVQTSTEVGGEILEIVEGTWSLARAVQLAAMLIAALTIANTMLIAVLERRWEFGLQRAVGMSLSQLGRSVVLEAGVIGVIGAAGAALLGTLLGVAMTQLMEGQFSWTIPFAVPFATIGMVALGATAISVGAALHPRAVALRAPIIESLRYE